MKIVLLVVILLLSSLVGCQAEREVVPPKEPDWSYRDGPDPQASSAWERFEQESVLVQKIQSVERR